MPTRDIKTRVSLEGAKEYSANVKSCNLSLKEYRSELKLAEETYKDSANSMEALSKKGEILQKMYDTQNTKVSTVNKALGEARQIQGRYADQVEQAEAALKKAKDTQDAYAKSSEQSAEEQERLQKAVDAAQKELDDSRESYNKSTELVTRYQTKVNDAETELEQMRRALDTNQASLAEARLATESHTDALEKNANASARADDGIDEYGKSLKRFSFDWSGIKDVFFGTSLAGAFTSLVGKAKDAVVDFAKESIQVASDLVESQNVIDVTFGKSNTAIEAWASSAASNYTLSELAAKQALGTIGALLKTTGEDMGSVTQMSTDLVGRAADLASFFNLDFSDALQKLRSGLSGEAEPLKALNVYMNEANLKAFAASKGLADMYATMSAGEKIALRYDYIMEQTAQAEGDIARNSDTYATKTKELDATIENLSASIGQNLLPVATAFKSVWAGILTGVEKVTSGDARFSKAIDDFDKLREATRDTSIDLIQLQQIFKDTDFEFDWSSFEDGESAVAAAIDAFAGYRDTLAGIETAASLAAAAEAERAAQEEANIAQIDEYKAKLEELNAAWQEEWEQIRANVETQIGLFQDMDVQVDTSVGKMVDSLKSQSDYMATYAANLQKAAELGIDKGLLKQLADGTVQSAEYLQAIVDDGGAKIEELNEAFRTVEEGKDDFATVLQDASSDLKTQMAQMVVEVQNGVRNMDQSGLAFSAGVNTAQGLINGINSKQSAVAAASANLGRIASEAYNRTMVIRSPSKVMEWSGEMSGEGVVKGVEKKVPDAAKAFTELAQANAKAYNDQMAKVSLSGIDAAVSRFAGRVGRASASPAAPTNITNNYVQNAQRGAGGVVRVELTTNLDGRVIAKTVRDVDLSTASRFGR